MLSLKYHDYAIVSHLFQRPVGTRYGLFMLRIVSSRCLCCKDEMIVPETPLVFTRDCILGPSVTQSKHCDGISSLPLYSRVQRAVHPALKRKFAATVPLTLLWSDFGQQIGKRCAALKNALSPQKPRYGVFELKTEDQETMLAQAGRSSSDRSLKARLHMRCSVSPCVE